MPEFQKERVAEGGLEKKGLLWGGVGLRDGVRGRVG